MLQLHNRIDVVFVLLMLTIMTSGMTFAQSAPSQAEITNYGELHRSAYEDDIAKLSSLIRAGADIEARDRSGRTPLIIAAFASNEASVDVLAKAGAELNALDNQAYDIVTIAAVANDLDMLDLALKSGASSGNVTSPYEGTALIAAAHLGHHAVVNRLISAKAPLDHVNNLNWTALIEAVILGDGGQNHIETVRLLITAGADKSIGDSQGITALQHAKSRGYSEIVKLLKNGD